MRSAVEEIHVKGDPDDMKKILRDRAVELRESKSSFKVNASMSQRVVFKSKFGMSMEKYIIDILKPQKPIFPRRKIKTEY